MSRGKKYDAAEKHFESKCVEWRKKTRELEQSNIEMTNRYVSVCKENEKLKQENAKLREQNEILAELESLSKEDIKVLVKTGMSHLDDMLSMMNGGTWFV